MAVKSKLSIFAKGWLMGVCDLIPGISGGTIAFITGIYYRLIDAVRSIFSVPLVWICGIFSGKERGKLSGLGQHLWFLIILGSGIVCAVLTFSRLIDFLLKDYYSYTLAFFMGIIVVSSKIIYTEIEETPSVNTFFIIPGLIIGVLLVILVPLSLSPRHSYVFLGGFLASSAMFLPGISGAFILLIMGLYEFLIDALHRFSDKLSYLIVFGAGLILGAFVISRVVSFLFRVAKEKILYLLLGLVLGGLSVPLRKIISAGDLQEATDYFFISAVFCCGMLITFMLNMAAKRKK